MMFWWQEPARSIAHPESASEWGRPFQKVFSFRQDIRYKWNDTWPLRALRAQRHSFSCHVAQAGRPLVFALPRAAMAEAEYIRRWPVFEPVRDDVSSEWWSLQPLPEFPGAPTTEHGTLPEWRRAMADQLRACHWCCRRATSRRFRAEILSNEWSQLRPLWPRMRMQYCLSNAANSWAESASHHKRMASWTRRWLALGSALEKHLDIVFKEIVDTEWELAEYNDSDAEFHEDSADHFIDTYQRLHGNDARSSGGSDSEHTNAQ